MRRVPALLCLAALAACSSSHKTAANVQPGDTTSPSVAASATSTAAPSAPASAGSSGAPTTASPTASAGRSASPRTGASNAPQQAPKATPAGTYTYDSHGTQTYSGQSHNVSSTSTLSVTALQGDAQTSTLHNSQGDTTQHLVMKVAGTFLSDLTISGPGLNKEFRFAPPALLLADPAKVGSTWTWRSTSTDGQTTVSATNKVLRDETVSVGSTSVPTVVLETKLVITDKQVTYTADETNWVAPAYRLPVKTRTVGNGKYGFVTFSFDVTDVLRSVHPA